MNNSRFIENEAKVISTHCVRLLSVLPRHLAVLGTTGGGKSTTVSCLIEQVKQQCEDRLRGQDKLQEPLLASTAGVAALVVFLRRITIAPAPTTIP